MTSQRTFKHAWLGILLLTMLGILGNYYSIEMFFGIDFLFGSIFIFIIVFTYGIKPGIIASSLSSFVTFFLWGHFFGFLILTAEVLAVYWLKRKKGLNIIISDALYWLLIGTPIIFLSYCGLLETEWLDTSIISLKYMVNGLLNCLIFSILHLIYEQYVIKKLRPKRFQELLFITFASVFLIPAMFLLIYEGNKEYREVYEEVSHSAVTKTKMISNSLTSWETSHKAALNTLRLYVGHRESMEKQMQELGRTLPYIQDIYIYNERYALDYEYTKETGLAFYDLKKLKMTRLYPYVTDVYFNPFTRQQLTSIVVPIHEKNYFGFAVATYRVQDLLGMLNRMDQREDTSVSLYNRQMLSMYQLSQVKKKQLTNEVVPSKPFMMNPLENADANPMSRWKESYLAVRADIPYIPWHPFIQVQIEPYQNKLFASYIKLFGLIFIFIGISIAIAYWLSSTLVSSIRRLSFITEQISASKITAQNIVWPKTGITEVSRLTKSFEQLIIDFNRVMQELRKKQKKLEYFAHFDVLTNMHNRYSFTKHLEKELRVASQFSRPVALMFCDLDRFKLINDSLGHDTGDELLREISVIIREACGKKAILCRHGGDEFLIAVPLTGEETIEEISLKILDDISKPISIGDNEVRVTCSIGISLFPQHAEDIEGLISTADLAMYSAKEKGKNTFQLFNPELNSNLARRVAIEKELQKALDSSEFSLQYQPQISLNTMEMTGLEALIRWNNPRLGSVSPAEFIPIAEETGIIRKLGEWVIDQAAADLRKLNDLGLTDINVAVNISIKQFYHESLPSFIMEKLAKHDVPARQFKIEITESVVIGHFELVLNQLHILKEAGIQIALDDFGTGFSSLNYLKILPIDIVKIDRSFIKDILNNEQDAAIVQAVIQIAESKSLTVIAEGVETTEQSSFLHSIGCPQGQGYIFSKPKPLEAIIQQLLIQKG
ncbi:EAL domain-containing protein [Bacillus sp. FJAT-42376]|uniref:EAL domain-containing protein n=1 Tax=Bacillus sp. FJAT-42376 TaxID=2014076 RepID=UPI0013DE4526|nr:EAL domain-containing protein [Bacillus sp. FJAT-42376]